MHRRGAHHLRIWTGIKERNIHGRTTCRITLIRLGGSMLYSIEYYEHV